jgi:hypothetical protein
MFVEQETIAMTSIYHRATADGGSVSVETVVQNFERLKQEGSGMSVGGQSVLVIRTLQSFLQGRHISENLRFEIPFFGTIKIALSGAVEAIERERVLGAYVPRNNWFHRTSPQPSMTAPEPSVEIQGPQVTVENTGSDAGMEMERQDTAVHFSNGHLQFSETSDVFEVLDSSEWSWQEGDILFFDSLVNSNPGGVWTL